MDGIFWLSLAVFGFWLTWFLRRFQVCWDAGQNRITALGSTLRKTQGDLAAEQQRLETLAGDLKVARRQAETARSDERAVRRQQKDTAPPPATEILVPSEFSSSANEVAWLAQLTPRFNMPIQPEARPIRYVLLWASGHQAALSRARQIAGERQLAVYSLQPFAKGAA